MHELDYIRTKIRELAAAKYPNDQEQQLMYTIGFLQAQLAACMLRDSLHRDHFIQAINSAKRG
jgi:hypothetical protein